MSECFPPIDGGVLEGIAKIIGDTNRGLNGSEIGKFLPEAKLTDIDPTYTKWKRIFNSFVDFQNRNKTGNNILNFIKICMNPSRFVGKTDQFEYLKGELNKRICFIGLELLETGGLAKVTSAFTISEAEQRANNLKYKLELRNAHPKIFEFCSAELLAENYFHTVFEAVKSVAEIIRNKSGLTTDGSALIEEAFSIRNPLIQINGLSNETEESEHKGFANLIKGVFGMFRNTIAHSPKIIWEINEQDALDILSTISLIHRRLGINE